MQQTVTAQRNLILVKSRYTIDNQTVIEVECNDYSDYSKLPPAVLTHDNKRLVKTGWNSDKCYACFKSEQPGQLVRSYA